MKLLNTSLIPIRHLSKISKIINLWVSQLLAPHMEINFIKHDVLILKANNFLQQLSKGYF